FHVTGVQTCALPIFRRSRGGGGSGDAAGGDGDPTMSLPSFLTITRGEAPLLVSLPHTGTEITEEYAAGLVSPWLARKDCDWWVRSEERRVGKAERAL